MSFLPSVHGGIVIGTVLLLSPAAGLSPSARPPAPPRAKAQPPDVDVATRMHAEPAARRVLERARQSIGGAGRLEAIRTLRMRGVRTLEAGQSRPLDVLLAMPARFRFEETDTFVINGERSWRGSGRTVNAQAKRNLLSRFAEYALVFLLRAPDQMPLSAKSIGDGRTADDGVDAVVSVEGQDGFARTLVFDNGTGRLKSMQERGPLQQGGASRIVERHVTIQEYAEVDGVAFPRVLSETIGPFRATIRFEEIEVNAPINRKEFAPPGGGR